MNEITILTLKKGDNCLISYMRLLYSYLSNKRACQFIYLFHKKIPQRPVNYV